MKPANQNGRVNSRRIKALERLNNQLKLGTKPINSTFTNETVYKELDESDIKRIQKEISILESKIVTEDVARRTRTKKYSSNRASKSYYKSFKN
jgi:phage FluMu protein gp41